MQKNKKRLFLVNAKKIASNGTVHSISVKMEADMSSLPELVFSIKNALRASDSESVSCVSISQIVEISDLHKKHETYDCSSVYLAMEREHIWVVSDGSESSYYRHYDDAASRYVALSAAWQGLGEEEKSGRPSPTIRKEILS